jgi:CheY-like chemotaxis protein
MEAHLTVALASLPCRSTSSGKRSHRGRGRRRRRRGQGPRPRPDLILMDIQLPVLDGYDATRQIKAMPDLAATPIIAVSSFATKGDEEKASASGCDGYVTTPYSTPKLLSLIRGFLGENALTIGSGLRIRHRGVTARQHVRSTPPWLSCMNGHSPPRATADRHLEPQHRAPLAAGSETELDAARRQ